MPCGAFVKGPSLQDQQRAEIIHIGVRRPRDYQITQGLKEAVGVIAVQVGRDAQTRCLGARQGVGRHTGTGVVLHAIDAVRVCRQRPHPLLPLQGLRQSQAEFARAATSPRGRVRGTRSVWRAEREAAADQRPVEYGYPYRRSICLKASAPTAGS